MRSARRVNELSVAARAEPPFLPTFLAYLAATYVFLRAGFCATAWVAARWARQGGEWR